MQTRAAILSAFPAERPYATSRPLSIERVELDDPGRGEVLVRVAAAGLCHSDLSVINGDRPRPMPMALGHEAAGVVERVGEDVPDLVPGDHVVMVFVPSCGSCAPCAEGRPALCEPGAAANNAGTLLSGARRIHKADHTINHHLGCSAFAEHAVVSHRSLVKVDREMPLERAALFGCAVLTGVGAVVNTAAVRAGETVAVVGLGGVGLSAVLGALSSGAAQVIAIDVNPDKAGFAASLGATAVFDPRGEDTVAAIRELTRGGVDVAVETAGVAAAFKCAYDVTRRGGRTVTASLPNPAVTLPATHVSLVAEERTVRGSYLGGGVPRRDIARYMALNAAGRLPVEKLHTGTDPLDKINEGFDALAEGATIRRLISIAA
ncbi:zinc-dependent alcohol dehydrogenase family protein [Acuticoccus sediminis]|uniref:zinc-dependent alcohol dehydrogenase family protein n=1 Tax=Acuticoccus sediminis TaxID=2184697 RepID=UPI001CFD4745|nr:zinc-dependent alcohol dehydrogenase family protein [Acuticoccus sediminis]